MNWRQRPLQEPSAHDRWWCRLYTHIDRCMVMCELRWSTYHCYVVSAFFFVFSTQLKLLWNLFFFYYFLRLYLFYRNKHWFLFFTISYLPLTSVQTVLQINVNCLFNKISFQFHLNAQIHYQRSTSLNICCVNETLTLKWTVG